MSGISWMPSPAELAALQQSATIASHDGKRLQRELTARVADVEGLLGRHMPQARRILRKLIVGRLTCETFEKGGQRRYRFTGQGTYEHPYQESWFQRMW